MSTWPSWMGASVVAGVFGGGGVEGAVVRSEASVGAGVGGVVDGIGGCRSVRGKSGDTVFVVGDEVVAVVALPEWGLVCGARGVVLKVCYMACPERLSIDWGEGFEINTAWLDEVRLA